MDRPQPPPVHDPSDNFDRHGAQTLQRRSMQKESGERCVVIDYHSNGRYRAKDTLLRY
jgi:hypothetical protein